MVSTEEKRKMGKKARVSGAAFEAIVRKDLEAKGWICAKWTNNVEFPEKMAAEDIPGMNMKRGDKVVFYQFGKLVSAKPHMVFNPVIKRMIPLQSSSGFPDYLCFRRLTGEEILEMMKNGV